jgi:histone H3
MRAVREIRRPPARHRELLVQKAPFQRLVRELASKQKEGLRFQTRPCRRSRGDGVVPCGLAASGPKLCAIHTRRVTIQPKDVQALHLSRGAAPAAGTVRMAEE